MDRNAGGRLQRRFDAEWFDGMPDHPDVMARAVWLRARSLESKSRQWRLPEALIVTGAIDADADRLITTDAKKPPVDALEVVVLTS